LSVYDDGRKRYFTSREEEVSEKNVSPKRSVVKCGTKEATK